MRITALKPLGRNRARIELHLDGEPRLTIATEVAVASGFVIGRELSEAELVALESEDARVRAGEAALNLLSYRPRTERELRRRLARKGFDPSIVDPCIDNLTRAGLIDDAAFARTFAADRVRTRPSGRARLAADLRSRGVNPDDAAAALDEICQPGSEAELELARRSVVKFPRRDQEDSPRVKRRLQSYLMRRGFTRDTIAQILQEELPRS